MEPSSLSSGFREIAHTADWMLEAWAPSLTGLFIYAAQGMYSLMGLQPVITQPIQMNFDLEAADTESLLVAFLSELLYLLEEEKAAAAEFHLRVENGRVQGTARGWQPARPQKEIKAVTFHGLQVRCDEGRWITKLTFDV